jgi:hypothetical protein
MTSTETLIRALADRAELADLVARHSLWIDEGRDIGRHLRLAHFDEGWRSSVQLPAAIAVLCRLTGTAPSLYRKRVAADGCAVAGSGLAVSGKTPGDLAAVPRGRAMTVGCPEWGGRTS